MAEDLEIDSWKELWGLFSIPHQSSSWDLRIHLGGYAELEEKIIS
jgi:hypothetical protein